MIPCTKAAFWKVSQSLGYPYPPSNNHGYKSMACRKTMNFSMGIEEHLQLHGELRSLFRHFAPLPHRPDRIDTLSDSRGG